MTQKIVQISQTAYALAQQVEQARTLAQSIRAFVIQNQEQRDLIHAKMVEVKTLGKSLETERTSATKPLNGVLRTINSWFKPHIDTCDQVEAACKDALWRHDKALAQEQQRKLDEAAAAFQAGQTSVATQALAAIPDIPATAGTSVGTRVVLRVVDPNLVPREYCSPDASKLALVPKGSPAPAGCVWEEQANVRVRL